MSMAAGPANANFFLHHLDAAMAAEHLLKRYLDKDFTSTDLAPVVAAARELNLSEEKAAMLELSGAGKKWYVPNKDNAWYKVSSAVIYGVSCRKFLKMGKK